MKEKKFCCADNFSVIIPYRELEKMLESANKIAHIEALAKRMDERVAAMQLLYSEMLEKLEKLIDIYKTTALPFCPNNTQIEMLFFEISLYFLTNSV